ncbi:hypothetical protein [Nitrospira sp. Nam80]|jgi:hypothetical protein
MGDKELKLLIDTLWKTTFVLDDGRRLKTIPIEWNKLTLKQQSTAISELRRLIIKELKTLPTASRLHLEFSDIPPELRAILVDIGGEANPDFTWGIVETAS